MMVESFMTERKGYVEIKGSQSIIFSLPPGVPQGSVLGPKLFSIFANGL